jgi:GDP-mannose 6-dehydrogenase
MQSPPVIDRPGLNIGVVGLGYVGAVTAACLARLGHMVYGFERDPLKVAKLEAGISPFYEPDLDTFLKEARDANRLAIHQGFDRVMADLDMMLICVGTPTRPDGAHDSTQLERVCEDLSSTLRAESRRKPLTIAIRSTVTPGTTADLRSRFFIGLEEVVGFVYIPEFLREGTAIKDFFEPALLVVGADEPSLGQLALGMYHSIEAPKRVLPIRAAEMVKGVCNAFHALKAAFANETGSLAAACGIDAEELMAVICEDTRLNISAAYLKPGFAFGGSCLPKDVRALNHLARETGLRLPLYGAILPSNERHLERAAERVIAAGLKRAGFLGLSFKAQTDDMRESPALQLAAQLKRASVDVRAFDSDIRPAMLHGANLGALHEVFGTGVLPLAADLEELIDWADGLVLTKRPAPAVMARLCASGRVIVDVSRLAL